MRSHSLFTQTATHSSLQRRILRLISLGTLLTLMLAACGAPAVQPTHAPVTLVITASKTGNELEVLNHQLAAFMQAYPHIKVITREIPDIANERHILYEGYLQNRDAIPDVYIIELGWPAEFYENGWIMPLDDLIKQHNFATDDFLVGPLEAGNIDGRQVAIPSELGFGILYYRKDLLERYGYPVPQTWEELRATALALKEQANLESGFIWQAAPHEGLTCNALEFVWSYGGTVLDKQGQLVFNAQATIDAYTMMKELVISGASPEGVTAHKQSDSRNLFEQGQAAFMRNWTAHTVLLEAPNTPVAGNVGIAPLPSGPGGTSASFAGGWHLAISAFTKHPQEAFQLVSFLTSKEQQIYKTLQTNILPTRQSVYQDAEVISQRPYYKDLLASALGTTSRPKSSRYAEISEIIYTYTNDYLVRKSDPAETVDIIADQLDTLLNIQ